MIAYKFEFVLSGIAKRVLVEKKWNLNRFVALGMAMKMHVRVGWGFWRWVLHGAFEIQLEISKVVAEGEV